MRRWIFVLLAVVVLASLCLGQAMCDEGRGSKGNVTISGYILNLPCAKPVKFYPTGATTFGNPSYSCTSNAAGFYSCVVYGPATYKIGVDNTWWCTPNVQVTKSVGTMTGVDVTAQAPPAVSCSRSERSVTVSGNIANLHRVCFVGFYGVGATDFNNYSFSGNTDNTGHYSNIAVQGLATYKIGVDKTWWCTPTVSVTKSVGSMTLPDVNAQPPPTVQ